MSKAAFVQIAPEEPVTKRVSDRRKLDLSGKKYNAITGDYSKNKYGVNWLAWTFYLGEWATAITALVVGIVFTVKCIDQGDDGHGKYPLRYSVASAENYSDYTIRVGVMFFSMLIVSGASFIALQALACLPWFMASDEKRKTSWSPIHKYTYDMQTMTGYYDGIRYAGTFWAPYVAMFIIMGTREISSLGFLGLLVILSYLFRVNAGFNRQVYRETDNENLKEGIRTSAAWMYITGLAVHIIIFVLAIIQFSYRRGEDVPFNKNEQGFALLVAVGGFVEYWFVFGMRSSIVLRDIKITTCSEAPYVVAKFFSLSWIYTGCGNRCFDADKHEVLIGWMAHTLSRGIELSIWIAGGIMLYLGSVDGNNVTA